MCFSISIAFLSAGCQTNVTVKDKTTSIINSMTSVFMETKLLTTATSESTVTVIFFNAPGAIIECTGNFKYNVDINQTLQVNMSNISEATTKIRNYLKNTISEAIKSDYSQVVGFLGSVPTIKTTTDLQTTLDTAIDEYYTTKNIQDVIAKTISTDTITITNFGIITAKDCDFSVTVVQNSVANNLYHGFTQYLATNKATAGLVQSLTEKTSISSKGAASLIDALAKLVGSFTGAYAIIGVAVVLVIGGIIALIVFIVFKRRKARRNAIILLNKKAAEGKAPLSKTYLK